MTTQEIIFNAKSEILTDCFNGLFKPEDIGSFSDLHDFVDANYYGGFFEMENINFEQVNEVQSELDKWIKEGVLHDLNKPIDFIKE